MGASAWGQNVAPTISGSPSKSATVGVAYAFQPTAADANGNALIFSIFNKPGWGTFDTSTGRLSGTPTVPYTHSNITIRVSDGLLTASLPVFTISVTGAPAGSAPIISGMPIKTAQVGSAYVFQPTASDPQGRTLGFSIMNKPGWATFSTATGRLSGTPTAIFTHSNIVISVSNGLQKVSLPAFAITVSAGSVNSPPSISGTPPISITAGTAYNFQPTASDVNGDPLTFSVANKPSWAIFNSATGRLSGTPSATQIGTYSNVIISVSDAQSTRSLPAFSIAVNANVLGSATVTWTIPTRNEDGSSLTDLTSYRIYYGTSPSNLDRVVPVTNSGLTSYVIDNLSPGTYYFSLTAINSRNEESQRTNPVSKVVQ
jgi:hypothetical protein